LATVEAVSFFSFAARKFNVQRFTIKRCTSYILQSSFGLIDFLHLNKGIVTQSTNLFNFTKFFEKLAQVFFLKIWCADI